MIGYLCLLLLVDTTFGLQDAFNEELFLRQLSSGHLYSMFQFTTYMHMNIFDENMTSHFNLFPRSFAEIVSAFDIVELHLTLTQGRWRYNRWGYPIENAPTGIALWILFHPDLNETAVDKNWEGVVHALSGQFCSSLNFITKEFTAKPALSFKPSGLWDGENVNSHEHLRFATLSRETVCTENLTPWKRLLPCGDHAGFASLLEPSRLFDSSYVSIGVNLRSVCDDEACTNIQLELKQSISHVHDGNRAYQPKWSLRKLFGSKLFSRCPVATVSNLLVDLNEKGIDNFSLSSTPDREIYLGKDKNIKKYLVYDISKSNLTFPFDVSFTVNFNKKPTEVLPYLLLHKYTTGYGVEIGGIVCLITNTHPNQSIKIVYVDVIPYYVRVYLHTLKIKVNGIEATPEKLLYVPGYYRENPASIEFILTIPAKSTASVTIEFEKVFLDWMQYKPDANHGFYLGSSVVSAYFPESENGVEIPEQCSLLSNSDSCNLGKNSKGNIFRRIFSEPLLIRVPLPDFSMPYNVLCLTCTVIAIGFGSIYNLSTKTFHVEEEKKKRTIKEVFIHLKAKLISAVVIIKAVVLRRPRNEAVS